jgi:hypothetical protein
MYHKLSFVEQLEDIDNIAEDNERTSYTDECDTQQRGIEHSFTTTA